MTNYEKYKWIIDNIIAYLREENTPEDRMNILKYITDSILNRCLDAKLLNNEKACERCNR